MGDVAFWKLAMKPGRPFAFGRLAHDDRRAWLFALPGNPVAAVVAFHALVRDALLAMAGVAAPSRTTVTAPVARDIAKQPGRTEFVRAALRRDDDGRPSLHPLAAQGAAMLQSLADADCLVVLGHDRGPVAAGELVEAWPLTGLD